MSDHVVIGECFARDGLQHEPEFIPTATKVALLDAFTAAGFQRIEATSYSHPDQVPAFRDAREVLQKIKRGHGTYYKVTCPNLRAVTRALVDLDAGFGASELSLLTSATEGHTQRNLKTDRATQWRNVANMVQAAQGRFRLIGTISVALGCPFEGAVSAGQVLEDIGRFRDLGVTFIALGDTTGYGTPAAVRTLFRRILDEFPDVVPIAHFHNTRGTAIVNCVAALEAGCRYFDSAFGGVGGHPAQIQYGEGLTGNVATEDLVNLFEEMGVATDLDLDRVMAASRLCEQALGQQLHSMVARAGFGVATQARLASARA